MGLLITATTGAGQAPDVEPGLYDARFDGMEAKTIENSQYDPNVIEWAFTLFEEGKAIYDDGDPIVLTSLSSQSINFRSKQVPRAVRYLRAICTPEELDALENGQSFDSDALIGRMVQVQVEIKDSGWPKVTDVVPGRPTRRARAN